jgi:lauroyl/myristoyl acyltransferase
MTKQFIKHGSTMVKAKDSKTLITTLKSGLPIWYAPDQDLGAKHSTFFSKKKPHLLGGF